MKKVFKSIVLCLFASLLSLTFVFTNPIISQAESEFNEVSCDWYSTGYVSNIRPYGGSLHEGFSEYGSLVFKYKDAEAGDGDSNYIKLFFTDRTKTEIGKIMLFLSLIRTNENTEGYASFDFIYNGVHYVGHDIEMTIDDYDGEYRVYLDAADYIVVDEVPEVAHCLMYRLYNPNSGEHFYTGSTEELEHLKSIGWVHEGNGFEVPVLSDTPVYRLYNPNAGDHHYTTSEAEKNILENAGWNYEGIAWYSAPDTCNPLYRLNNPNATSGAHHFTMSEEERDNLVRAGWILEGIGWYGY